MFYLILATLSSTANAIVMRVSQKYVKNKYSMLAGNYIACVVLGLCFLYPESLMPAGEGIGLTWLLGALCGVFYLGGFLTIQYNTEKNGIVLTSVFSKLGIVVPTVLAVAVFGERPSVLQVLGLVLALAAIVFMNTGKQKTEGRRGLELSLLLLMLVNGCGDSMAKVYREVGRPEFSDQFLVCTFLFALLYNGILVLVKHERPGWTELLFGLLLGIPNYFVTRFLLRAVTEIPAVIVYPTFSVATILLSTLAGVLIFRERLTRRQGGSIVVILAALALLNL